MLGVIKDGVVIQYAPEITMDQVNAILKQSQDEFRILRISLGGLDITVEDHDIVIQAWQRGPNKHSRRILDQVHQQVPAVVIPMEQETDLFAPTENPVTVVSIQPVTQVVNTVKAADFKAAIKKGMKPPFKR